MKMSEKYYRMLTFCALISFIKKIRVKRFAKKDNIENSIYTQQILLGKQNTHTHLIRVIKRRVIKLTILD